MQATGLLDHALSNEFGTSIRTQAFINGTYVDAESGSTLTTYNPSTGAVLANVTACEQSDVDRAVKAARRAFDDGCWRRRSPGERKAALFRLAALIESDLDTLSRLEAADAGRPIGHTRHGDVPHSAGYLRWYGELADKVFGKISATDDDHLAMIVKEPVGVVAAVIPWNYPLAIACQKMGPCLATGSSIIIKPPEQASLSVIRLAELAAEAGIPEGVVQVVPGYGEVAGRALGLHNDVDAVTFTGSTAVGREFLRYAADSNMKRVTLECGGKSPQVVLSDAGRDVEAVAKQLAAAAFEASGQNCTCGSRLIVNSSLHDEVLEAFTKAADWWRVGSSLDDETHVGPIIEPDALKRIMGYIDGARSDGAQVAYGGRRLYEETGGWYVEPTILDGVSPDWRVARDEIFGPVVSVLTVKSDEEAAALANDTSYGLGATIYTHDLDRAHRVARQIRAGSVSVNEYSEGDFTTPFGGFKQSGFGGRDKGVEALDQYTEIKTIWFGFGS